MKDGPFYITTLKVRNVFVPVRLKVACRCEGQYQIVYNVLNEAMGRDLEYRNKGGSALVYPSEELARFALDDIARALRLVPFKTIERW